MARDRYKFIEGEHPHFLTCTIVNWLPIFASPACAKIVLNSLQFLQKQNRLVVYAYVIMENHLHLIASSENLSKEMGDFKSFTARKIIDYLQEKDAKRVLGQLKEYRLRHRLDRDYQLWQQGSHPKVIMNEKMMVQKIDYIHQNPVKRGYVDEPVHWRYSSVRNYEGGEGLIPVETEWL
ncbi:MAG: REP-associated tyrosine transposase [Candidatus Promineifilaceae bacterium]